MTRSADAWVANARDRHWTGAALRDDALTFHRSLPGYAPTPLVDLPSIAAELGVGRVLAKDESTRLGLPAFKALGASWAVDRALAAAAPSDPGRSPATVVTATDGNHGRAVARFARLAGHPARICIPRGGVHPAAVQAIRDEGAEVVEIDGGYDAAVAAAAASAASRGDVLVQDTAWEGYEEVPAWIVEGYATLFAEVDQQLAEFGLEPPDLVVVPTGVGSLLQSALAHYRSVDARGATAVISVEPTVAACVAASLAAGALVSVDTGHTAMSGLNCGTPSSLAWPIILAGLDAGVAVTDDEAISAAHTLADLGVPAGPCGAAALAGARSALLGPDADDHRLHLGLTAESVVVLTITEGSSANPLPALRH
jgi:diaminopropionate ammonia-lyase